MAFLVIYKCFKTIILVLFLTYMVVDANSLSAIYYFITRLLDILTAGEMVKNTKAAFSYYAKLS